MHNFITERKKSKARVEIVSLRDEGEKERKGKFNFKKLNKSNKKWLWWQHNINTSYSLSLKLIEFHFSIFVCSVKTDLMENGANSTLSIAKVRKTDGGNYTCSISSNDYHTINMQVINGEKTIQTPIFFQRLIKWYVFAHLFPGESLAELYHGSAVCSHHKLTLHNWIGIFVSTIIVLSRYINISDAFKVMTIDERRFIK